MNYKTPSPAGLIRKSIGIFIVLLTSVILFSCPGKKEKKDPLKDAIIGLDTRDSLWASWNVLMQPGSDYDTRTTSVANVMDELERAFTSRFSGLGYRLYLSVFYCPCDSLLYNIGAKVLNGSGQSVTLPAPPQPPAGSGNVAIVSVNNPLLPEVRDPNFNPPDTSYDMVLGDPGRENQDDTTVLAIIDTGLDPGYFPDDFRRLIWKAEGVPTIYNVTDASTGVLFDDHEGRHGTFVAATALKAIQVQNRIFQSPTNHWPRLMILKALDKNKQGSTFTVSCGLSYAIQHHAAAVNASLGYYDYSGNQDAIFRHYIDLCNQQPKPILVFAAAGNTTSLMNTPLVCNEAPLPPIKDNQLYERRTFYPACFTPDFSNVISITSITDLNSSCFYQNYSSQYVSFGVLQAGTDPNVGCCHFSVEFSRQNVPKSAILTGSSFATPVAAGTSLSYILNSHPANDFIQSLSRAGTLDRITKGGRYFSYSAN